MGEAAPASFFWDYSRAWGIRMEETPWQCDVGQEKSIQQISHAVELASRYTPWRSSCLVQAAAAMTLLGRRKLDCTLYLGTAKNAAGRLAAHAWVRSGPIYVTGNGRWKHLRWWGYSEDVL